MGVFVPIEIQLEGLVVLVTKCADGKSKRADPLKPISTVISLVSGDPLAQYRPTTTLPPQVTPHPARLSLILNSICGSNIHTRQIKVNMAAPPEKTLKDLNGKWVMVRFSSACYPNC